MIKPITPKEAGKKTFPDFVIEAVNALVQKEYRNGYANILQSAVKTAINDARPAGTEFESWWLDFEAVYEEAGWTVKYDRPGFNESYAPCFIFSEK